MWLKKYLNLSKGEYFLLILFVLFALFLLLGIKVEKNLISVFFVKIPLSIRGKIAFVLWKNYHGIMLSFLFFSSLVLSVYHKESPLLKSFAFLFVFYIAFSLIFGIKFGFAPFVLSIENVFFMLFSVFAHLYFFETLLNSRLVGALYVLVINSFSGLMVYLYNFREMILPNYSGIIEAKYRAFPLYQKFYLQSVDFKDLIFPFLLLVTCLIYKYLIARKLKNA